MDMPDEKDDSLNQVQASCILCREQTQTPKSSTEGRWLVLSNDLLYEQEND